MCIRDRGYVHDKKDVKKDVKEDEMRKLAGLTEAKDDMPSKAQVMKCCKDGMSVAEICKKFPDCDQDKLKELCKDCKDALKQKDQVEMSEAMMDAYGVSDCGAGEPGEQVGGSVSFKQEKNTDKGSVSIEANADDMQELAKVLKMAGLTLPKDMSGSEASAGDEEPEQEEILLPKNDDEAGGDDAEKQNAKQTLVNIIKDKLQKRLK